MSTLHNNSYMGQRYIIEYNNDYNGTTLNPYAWFVQRTCNEWDYKWNSEWQVPYNSFNGEAMNVKLPDGSYAKNWTGWIYFDGMIMAADEFGNLNLGYVGTKMGFSGIELLNFATKGGGDDFWIQYGINLANQGR